MTAPEGTRDTSGTVRPWVLAACLLSSLPAAAQNAPAESLRAGPTPARVEDGGVIAFARTFRAQRAGDALMVVYTENGPAGRATLRSALLRAADGALTRAREDVTLAPDARTLALAWSGDHAAAVYVVPRHPPVTAPGAPARRRAPAVGVPASTSDPLGPSNLSGGDLTVQRLDAEGRPVGAPVTLFTENARLTRVSAAWVGDRLLVAWTGGTVTDDEVRVTVRARSLGADGAPPRAMATHTGLSGDVGDTLEIVPRSDGGADLWVSASHCAATGSTTPALEVPADPSREVEAPNRVLMPQQPTRDAPGPEIDCGPFALHRITLDATDRVTARVTAAPLARDLAARGGDAWTLSVARDGGAVLATGLPSPDGALSLRAFDGAAITPTPPAPHPMDLSLRRHAEVDPPLAEAALAPPDAPTGDAALHTASVVARTEQGDLAALSEDRRTLLYRAHGAGAVVSLGRAPTRLVELSALGGATPWVLAREGVWSGPIRWVAPAGDLTARASAAWTRATPVPVAAPAPTRPPTTAPYVWDESFARLWVRARTARGIFMRHENSAGALAARPEAPTDPRMPAVIANRTRLRGRWETACGALQTRASQLSRHGAGPEVIQAVGQLCDIHADLQLGVPVNPAL